MVTFPKRFLSDNRTTTLSIMSNQSIRWAFNCSKWNPTPSEIVLASSCIQSEEKERLMKFVFKSDFKSSLIGRLMMRKFINVVTGTSYNQILFSRDTRGKPILIHPNYSLSFNISHQGNYTVLAGALGNLQIGIDVMKFDYPPHRNTGEYFRIMTRTFSDSEWKTIKSVGSETNQLQMFYRHWCLKESYVKAIGEGVISNLQEYSFKINNLDLNQNSIIDDTKIYVKGQKLDWEFHETLLDDEHCVTVAFNSKNQEKIFFKELSFNELMTEAVALHPPDQVYCDKFFEKLDKN